MTALRVLTVEPTAGLGNRMRVTASALALAERLACPLRLVWTRTGALGCRFDALFEPLEGVTVAEHSWTTSRIERVAGSRLGLRRVLVQSDVEQLRRSDRFDELAQCRHPYLVTCSRFLPARGYLPRLRIAPEIAQAVHEATAAFTPHTIGVHIRRGEEDPATHQPATAPLDAFLAAMRDRIESEPRTTFFLATDSRAEEAQVVSAFGERVITLPKLLDRRAPAAIRGALVDLTCLGRTAVILGSEWSSFSEIAAESGGIPLVVVGHGERHAGAGLRETVAG